MRDKRGFAIILVLATLVLLALLSLTYIKLALIDRNIARNYMDNKRAKLIAQSGVDYAIARIQELDLFDLSWQYDRLDPDLNPSFKAGNVTINGQTGGYSQIVGSTYSTNGDLFVLKIDDSQSKININDGLVNPRVRANLARIINNLAKIIDASFPDLGSDIIGSSTEDKRPQGGYSNISEIRKVLVDKYGSTGEEYYERLKPFATTHAWQDKNVANPVPLSSSVISDYGQPYANYDSVIGVYRYGRGYNKNSQQISGELTYAPAPAVPSSYNHAIYGLDELNTQWIEIVSRSPVNINTAKEQVLVALLKDLKGFFVSDRRRNTPYYQDSYDFTGVYNIALVQFDYSPAGLQGDELGFLYTTMNIDTTLAMALAQEVRNCRNKTGLYATNWFGSPFKTWRQFNAFCDNLVENILIDGRTIGAQSIFYENDLGIPGNVDSLKESEVARRQASQAMADVLKANFNPNLHLNETNPDANIKTLVDKTDLIVNSTEFCFTPMGYFEIESEGLILKPKDTDNSIIAKSNIETVVKLYDAYRETNQKQFLNHINSITDYNNFIGQDSTPVATNNMRTIQVGPEPDHIFDAGSPIASQNEWGGYIALATVNGYDSLAQATLYSHFSSDFSANYHADGISYQANLVDLNTADWTESGVRGPYTYNSNNRLARSFRQRSEISTYRAPSDLRIDGTYIERHAGIRYGFLTGTVKVGATWQLKTNVLKESGMACYWVKPWFYPETTGKPRAFLSFRPGGADSGRYFINFFLPSHWPVSVETPVPTPVYTNPNPGYAYRTTSLIFCQGLDSGYGHMTPPLNHISHYDSLGSPLPCHPLGAIPKTNYLKSGQWIHVACMWNVPYNLGGAAPTLDNIQIWINGDTFSDSSLTNGHGGVLTLYTVPNGLGSICIGEPITEFFGDYRRGLTCDSTVDEFYIFAGDRATMWDLNRSMYTLGRYYTLGSSNLNETSYVSGTLDLAKQLNTPSNSTIEGPSGSGEESVVSTPKAKIIGLSWTYYGEAVDVDAEGNPVIKNYKDYMALNVLYDLAVNLDVTILKNYNPTTGIAEAEYGPFDQDGYSSLDIEMDSSAQYRYKVTFKIEYDPANPDKNPLTTVLLATPVFDDITIYYTTGIKFLSYFYFN